MGSELSNINNPIIINKTLKLKILTFNVRGFNTVLKRTNTLNMIKDVGASITVLTETKLNTKPLERNEDYQVFQSPLKT